MKKITCAMLMVAGLGASAAASAAVSFVPGDTIDTTECTLLSEGVTLTLSKNVRGAYNCDTTYTDIRVMTCHDAGSNKTTSIDCAVVGFMANGTDPIFSGAGCAAGQPWSIAGYRIFGGSSRGGTVAAQLNGGSCMTALPEGHTYFSTY